MTRSKLDPNNETEISNKLDDEYFFRNNEAARLQWGNTNLLHMKLGPGSSIKPLVLAAVASQRKLEWSELKYVQHNNLLINKEKTDQFIIEQYASKKLPIVGAKWSESIKNNVTTDLKNYITNSNNLYHSLLIFLGSYQKDDFNTSGSLKDKIIPLSNKESFPILQIGDGINYTFPDSSAWPISSKTHKYFDNENSMLAVGFKENLGLQTYSSLSSGRLTEKNNYSKLSSSIIYKNIWAFPERSYFDQKERGESFFNAIKILHWVVVFID